MVARLARRGLRDCSAEGQASSVCDKNTLPTQAGGVGAMDGMAPGDKGAKLQNCSAVLESEVGRGERPLQFPETRRFQEAWA